MTESMQSLYSAFRAHGLPKRQVQAFLPAWWDDEIAETPSGLQQAKFILARALNLKLRSIAETPARIEFDLPEQRRFKLIKGTTADDVELAVALARSASKIVLSNIERPYVRPVSAAEIRSQILASGKPWVGLSDLLDYCWECGIPVIHLASSIMKKKMDGIAMSINGRPSIVLSNVRKQGFLLFHLAHELGHIALGHLSENGAIVDDEIKNHESEEGRNSQEIEADRFAIELLTGNADTRLTLPRLVQARPLADTAIRFGKERQIDPTHAVLNVAHNAPKLFPLCVSAVKVISGESTDQTVVRERALGNLADGLDPDSEHLLRNLIA